MSLLHTISFAGSAVVAIYLLLYFLTKRYLPLLWHKVYLTVNSLLFLVSVAWLKSEYTGLINKCFGYEAWYQKNKVINNVIDHTVLVYQDGVYISNVLTYIIAFISVLLGISGLIVLTKKYLTVYQKMMKGVERFERGELVINGLAKGSKRQISGYICVTDSERRLQLVLCMEK